MTKPIVYLKTIEKIAKELINKAIPYEEIYNHDVTDEFVGDMEYIFKTGRLLAVAINGEVREGKSTVMAKLVKHANQALGKKMTSHYIAPDQFDFARLTKGTKENEEWFGEKYINNCCLGLDEYNPLSETGAGSTTENKYLEWFYDIAAARYIHRISVSPRRIQDPNANYIITIQHSNKKTKTTTGELYYRITTPNGPIIQLVGRIEIYVGDILKEKWYQEYNQRKTLKIDFPAKHGIPDARKLFWAETILKIYGELENEASFQTISIVRIKSKVERIAREDVQFHSMLSNMELVDLIKGLLENKRSILTLENKLAIRKEHLLKMKEPHAKQLIERQIRQIQQSIDDSVHGLKQDLGHYNTLIELWEEYKAI